MKVLSLMLFTGIILSGCSGARPSRTGPLDGRLPPCPASPNCVSSQSTDQDHAIEPLRFSGTAAEAMADLHAVLALLKRTKIVTESGGYLHAECTSLLLRFVDDLEFLIDTREQVIHVRSASRLGYSDLGVNRKRVETIRMIWERLHQEQNHKHPR
ncbi:MAG: DUF1499 domain-containing protein [Nitrospirota bacterium]|nr:DUF1499 domain-containing protein [Nitrospirota bacterium]